jgi:hypothetical protein
VRTLCLHRQLSPRSLWVIGLPTPMRLVTDLAHFAPRWSCPAVMPAWWWSTIAFCPRQPYASDSRLAAADCG